MASICVNGSVGSAIIELRLFLSLRACLALSLSCPDADRAVSVAILRLRSATLAR
ncbi:hypothetical protein PR001_g15884 [Phytophthora rubi]|uniref:Uncharacterized protein n=1 Tax=Phytophthora rubi TaxID=129364 RepID=A0A6A3L0N2_9STRA|nr:hypothetical protein PR001_g15884 [Phytophthora rubi]